MVQRTRLWNGKSKSVDENTLQKQFAWCAECNDPMNNVAIVGQSTVAAE